MTTICTAIVPGWSGTLPPFPFRVRAALIGSVLVAHVLSWLWFRRPLSRAAPDLLRRMDDHRWWPLRAMVQWWKLVALVARC